MKNNFICNYVDTYLMGKQYKYKSDNLGLVIIQFDNDNWSLVDYKCECNLDVADDWTDPPSEYEPPSDHIRYENYGKGLFSLDSLQVLVTIPRFGIKKLKCFIDCYILIDFDFNVENDEDYDGSFDAYDFEVQKIEKLSDDERVKHELIINRQTVLNSKVKELKSKIETDLIPKSIIKQIFDDFTENLMKSIEYQEIFVDWGK